MRHVVIIGGGFGGLEVARRLRATKVRVTLIDRNNYHLFQPLLYQVATGGLSPSNIASTLRYILRRQKNCEVMLAEVTAIDVHSRSLTLDSGTLSFDDLVVAVGATTSYFGHDPWQDDAPGLKSIEDALEIRRRIFLAFEAAEWVEDFPTRQALMTFVVVGGGPTGVELAGALSEIARHTLKHDFRHIDPRETRIILIEAAPHLLAHYPEKLRRWAEEKVRRLGIEVLTQTRVVDVNDHSVRVRRGEEEFVLQTRTTVWAAGVRANPLAEALAAQCALSVDRSGRVPVTAQLTVGEFDNIYAIGDMALCLDADGNPLPGLAPVAMQQGAYVAQRISAQVRGRSCPRPFRYHNRGTMATIGRAAAVAEIGKWQISGWFAWLLWLVVHLMQIVQFESRLLILIQWGWNYFTFNRSARLITGPLRCLKEEENENDSSTTVSPQSSSTKIE
ncbi:MAG: NADH dehydrogenase [Pirellulaceae bacterium]|nr:MAG: NADH dehydrogenase [Pirellulaceae bacterium]